tara:strand:- start:2093 stop:2863 length:771 start_codon:yes stop_codon:yes gene_type:complete
MKTKITSLITAGILGTTLASQAAVVFDSDFTGANLGAEGLTNSGVGGAWVFDAADDRAEFDHTARNGRASLYTSATFQSDGGFTLDASFLQVAAGSRFSIGIVDANYTVTGGDGWLTQAMPGAYGIGFVTSGIAGNDVLAFAEGTTAKNIFTDRTNLSTAQGNIAFNSPQTVSFTVTGNSYSYSLNGDPATTGSVTFDTSRSYRFIAYLQDTSTTVANGTVEGSYFSGITLTAVPEPSSTVLLGLGGLALILRRRK